VLNVSPQPREGDAQYGYIMCEVDGVIGLIVRTGHGVGAGQVGVVVGRLGLGGGIGAVGDCLCEIGFAGEGECGCAGVGVDIIGGQ